MPKEKSSFDDLFKTVPSSEPLKTYRDNINAINGLVGTSLEAIKQKQEIAKKTLSEVACPHKGYHSLS